jgi:hypothetical protein
MTVKHLRWATVAIMSKREPDRSGFVFLLDKKILADMAAK